jgi:suppressor for copper-sensitivity B
LLLSKFAWGSELPVALKLQPAIDSGYNFALAVDIQDGWELYGPDPSNEGKSMKIKASSSVNVSTLQVHWPKADNDVYKGDVLIPLTAVPQHSTEAISLDLIVEMVACNQVCVPLKYLVKSQTDSFIAQNNQNPYIETLSMLVLAILGGVLLNLMPCVLPIISIKAYSIINASIKSPAVIRANFIFTSLGIITSFLILAIGVVVMRAAGNHFGWGFQFHNTYFLVVLILIMFISAMLLQDEIGMRLPAIMPTFMIINEYGASFMSGVLSTVLSTSCTAPLITPVVAYALTQDIASILAIYSCIGVGMASPFIILSIFPETLKKFPKPGVWMHHLKYAFSIMLLLAVVWLLYIMHQRLGVKITLITGGLLLLLKFILTRCSSYVLWISALAVVLLMLITPKIITHQEALQEQNANKAWEHFSKEKLKEYLIQGEVVFVDVTADWCLLCKLNKSIILDNYGMIEFLKENRVKMMRADLTNPSPEIMEYLSENNRIAIPYNVIYGPHTPYRIVLSEILMPLEIKKAVAILKNNQK